MMPEILSCKLFADHLLDCVRRTDTVARIGGDEFLLLLTEIKTPRDIETIAAKVIESVAQPMEFEGQRLQVQASIGIALYPQHGHTAKTLIKQADSTMYAVKNSAKTAISLHPTRIKKVASSIPDKIFNSFHHLNSHQHRQPAECRLYLKQSGTRGEAWPNSQQCKNARYGLFSFAWRYYAQFPLYANFQPPGHRVGIPLLIFI